MERTEKISEIAAGNPKVFHMENPRKRIEKVTIEKQSMKLPVSEQTLLYFINRVVEEELVMSEIFAAACLMRKV